MIEMGIETAIMQSVLDGEKTIELRLRTPKFVTVRKGDQISLREDIWKNGRLAGSASGIATATVTETRFFDSFAEALDAIDYHRVLMSASTKKGLLSAYRQFYTDAQEQEHGVVAITFAIQK